MNEDWIKKYRHQSKGAKGVRVYYLMMGTNKICSDVVVSTKGNQMFFRDGWCHKKDCYLTAGQCRRASGIELRNELERVRRKVAAAGNALNDLEFQLAGQIDAIQLQ